MNNLPFSEAYVKSHPLPVGTSTNVGATHAVPPVRRPMFGVAASSVAHSSAAVSSVVGTWRTADEIVPENGELVRLTLATPLRFRAKFALNQSTLNASTHCDCP